MLQERKQSRLATCRANKTRMVQVRLTKIYMLKGNSTWRMANTSSNICLRHLVVITAVVMARLHRRLHQMDTMVAIHHHPHLLQTVAMAMAHISNSFTAFLVAFQTLTL